MGMSKALLVGALAALPGFSAAQDAVSYDLETYGSGDSAGSPFQTFMSNREVKPPEMQVNRNGSAGLAPGFVFIGVDGEPTSGQNWPTIWGMRLLNSHTARQADWITDFSKERQGTLIWTGNYTEPFDFRTQTYKGEPVLTFWSGQLMDGYGLGTYYILNQSYAEIAHFSPVGYDGGDLHEFSITDNDTALIIIYTPAPANLSSVGGDENGWIYDGVFQEIDIETGELRFEWNASTHVPVNETYNERGDAGSSEGSPWDYFHMNSVQKDHNGDFLVSARVMDCVYKISGVDGSIIWKFGGKASDFDVADEAAFAYQHDARWLNEEQTRMTLFNNGPTSDTGHSRGFLLEVNYDNMTVQLLREFHNEAQTFGQFEGSLQALDPSDENTNFFLGYGSEPFFAEFDSDGNLLLDVQFGATNVVNNYRAYKLAWQGKPTTLPDIHFDNDENNAYFSWNGATDVEQWVLYTANSTNGTWVQAAAVNRTGFETTFNLNDVSLDTYVRAKAVNADGDSLGWTQATDGNKLFDASGDVSDVTGRTPDSVTSTTSTTTQSTSPTSTTASESSETSGVAVKVGQTIVEKVIIAAVVVGGAALV